MSKKLTLNKEDAERIIKECQSIAEFCRAVGWKPQGDNYKIFHKYVEKYNLDTSHFTGQKSNLGNKLNFKKELSAKEYSKSTSVRGQTLLKKLIKEGIKESKCEICGLTEWLGKPISLELHHIDGNHFNNELSNLQILCPNCHSSTDSYCGKKNKIIRKCSNCGKEISRWSNSGLCGDCVKENQRKVERPTLEELENLLLNNSYVAVGKMFNVSDNTIRKWLKKYKK